MIYGRASASGRLAGRGGSVCRPGKVAVESKKRDASTRDLTRQVRSSHGSTRLLGSRPRAAFDHHHRMTWTTYSWWIGRLSVCLKPAAPRLSIVPQPSLATSSAATTTRPAFPLNPTHALAARRPIKPTSMSSQHALYTQTLSSCCIA